ncbi:MAG: orotate phosphoribosyltransferase [Chloroflexi bacterium]|nr:orotate phosphoribosyltransferase [Chloroflexota bacterium]
MTPGIDVPAILRASGALLDGHFILASGRHSAQYMEKFRILQRPVETGALCALMADHFRHAGVQVVIGPTLGGVILAYEAARALGVRAIYAERGDTEAEPRVFRRDFATIQAGERVLVVDDVDDVLTTGGSVQQVLDLVRRVGGEVVGVALLVDRSNGAVQFDVPEFFACHTMNIPSYPPESCPECAAGSRAVKPGSS